MAAGKGAPAVILTVKAELLTENNGTLIPSPFLEITWEKRYSGGLAGIVPQVIQQSSILPRAECQGSGKEGAAQFHSFGCGARKAQAETSLTARPALRLSLKSAHGSFEGGRIIGKNNDLLSPAGQMDQAHRLIRAQVMFLRAVDIGIIKIYDDAEHVRQSFKHRA